MKRSAMGMILSTFCFLALSACQEHPVLTASRPDLDHPDRFVCEGVKPGDRPAIPPEYAIDWASVQTVAQAHAEHDAYVRRVRDRNGVVTGYIVELEGRLFTCSTNMQWQLDYYRALPAPGG